jgi:hypothetical protein
MNNTLYVSFVLKETGITTYICAPLSIYKKNFSTLILPNQAVPLHAMKALGGRGGIPPTLS